MIEMHVLRAIGKGRGILWRTLARTPIEHNRLLLEQIKIETKEVTASKVITQRENYYFDISMTAVRGKPLPTAIAFLDNKTKLALPYELGWLHYNEVINNEPTAPGYVQTIAYGAPGAKATAYLYDKKRSDIPSNIEALVVRKEFEARRAFFLPAADVEKVGKVALDPSTGVMSPAIVGKPVTSIAELAGIAVPAGTRLPDRAPSGCGQRISAVGRRKMPIADHLSAIRRETNRHGCGPLLQ